MRRIAIIGAGAGGMSAAYFALCSGAHVTLFEKNRQVGRKICITGKGRCNLTNAVDVPEFLKQIPNGAKFLYSALYSLTPQDTIEWFERLGVPVKIERGNRVFPQSDRASDIRDALWNALRAFDAFTCIFSPVESVQVLSDGRFAVKNEAKTQPFDAVIVATGGVSYPRTGSTGDGHRFAKELGHTVTELHPSLVRIRCREALCSRVEGLSLKNVALTLWEEGRKKPLFREQGELVFTSDGISGPLALSASAFLRTDTVKRLEIDWKPALSDEQLDARLVREFSAQSNRMFKNVLDDLLPSAIREIFVELSGIDPQTKVHQITREERRNLFSLFRRFPLSILGPGPIDEAIVTAGGIALSEIDPHSMQSKLHPNLYFVGEVLDVDGFTGGFNLQIAFSCGKLAGEKASVEA